MTSGPLVLLEVDGQLPGRHDRARSDAAPRTVQGPRAWSAAKTRPVTDVQLIVNGRVVRER